MELENNKIEEITYLIRQKQIQLEFDNSDKNLHDIEQGREEQDQRIKKLIEDLDYGDRLEWIEYHKSQGSLYYQKQQYRKALNEYYLSMLALNDSKMWREQGISLIHNIQLILEYLKIPATKELLEFVLYIDIYNIKSYFKMGKFYSGEKKYQIALPYFQQGEKLCNQMQDKESQQDFQKQILECKKQLNLGR
ncbi:unnamed protein product [Paramecium primaurelia]|uniref:Tetratricopeptide repeat protein n=1 Tax=Paramecium primaurelia TaxID=5886 RepID=A0A8S1N9D1_PARPR|nr:unnamed protein product [Paramecium primaurelia]